MDDNPSDGPAAAGAHLDVSGEAPMALRVRGLSKTFPGVQALSDLDLDVRPGTVHALIGHNGCGKSTLVKTLAGVQSPDPGGRAWIDGAELQLGDRKDAVAKGLRFVHQELGIIPELGAVDNIGFVVGYERDGRKINWRRQARRTTELLEQFGFDVDPWQPLAEASPPQRAAVAIVRAVAGWRRDKGVLVLDEPTAALAKHEVEQLFRLIKEVSAAGTAVILVSHRLDEVMEIADHATVMRAGESVWDGNLAETTMSALIRLIANTPEEELHEEGRASAQAATPSTMDDAPVVAEVRDLRGRYLMGIDLKVHAGEVVGVCGLLGSGREELPYILAGDLSEGVQGNFTICGESYDELSVGVARRAGVALVPADRAREGIISEFTTGENVSIAGLPSLRSRGVVRPVTERPFVRRWLESVHADPETSVRQISTLSGGNQQKAVLARWLCVEPKLLVLSEPTAGVDIASRIVLYEEIRRRAKEGLAVLMASSDVEDLLASSDRVIVLRDGHIVGEFAGAQMTKQSILDAMEGVGSGQV